MSDQTLIEEMADELVEKLARRVTTEGCGLHLKLAMKEARAALGDTQ